MSELTQKATNPIRETTPEAIRLAKELVRTARFGSISVLDPKDGRPHVSRISIATDFDGTPVTLVSALSFHTKALLADPRCSLLVGEPGKGDPLAYPRVTLGCNAIFLDRSDSETVKIADRFLRANPKSKLYAGFADFTFVRLNLVSASLNGGFGKAFLVDANALLSPQYESLRDREVMLIDMLNGPESPLATRIALSHQKRIRNRISVTGVDSEGISIVTGNKPTRLWFAKPALTAENVLEEISRLPLSH